MFTIPLILACACLSVVGAIYALDLFLVIRTKKRDYYLGIISQALAKDLPVDDLPSVSVVMAAYNEESDISSTLRNIADLDYPRDRVEVVLVDDHSTDGTVPKAEAVFKELKLHGRILRNERRVGVNACLNRAFSKSGGDMILVTDSDVEVDHKALISGVRILKSADDVGGVTGRLFPIGKRRTGAVVVESSYRDWYHLISLGQSAIHSTFPGNGALVLLKRPSFPILDERRGSVDGNLSLGTIRKGLRFLYVPSLFFRENVCVEASEQRRQKTRRAARAIQAVLANTDMLFSDRYGSFGMLIFPLQFAMFLVCPVLFLAGLASLLFWVSEFSISWALQLVVLLSLVIWGGTKVESRLLNSLTSIVVHQFYLVLGLLWSRRPFGTWQPPGRNKTLQVRGALTH
jgi:glycosyltransferase involved in cell wall biosynthesis